MTLQHNCHIEGAIQERTPGTSPDVRVRPETAQHDVALFIVPKKPNVSLSLGSLGAALSRGEKQGRPLLTLKTIA